MPPVSLPRGRRFRWMSSWPTSSAPTATLAKAPSRASANAGSPTTSTSSPRSAGPWLTCRAKPSSWSTWATAASSPFRPFGGAQCRSSPGPGTQRTRRRHRSSPDCWSSSSPTSGEYHPALPGPGAPSGAGPPKKQPVGHPTYPPGQGVGVTVIADVTALAPQLRGRPVPDHHRAEVGSPPMTELSHITERASWAAASQPGEYRISTRGVTLDERGFVHSPYRTSSQPARTPLAGSCFPDETRSLKPMPPSRSGGLRLGLARCRDQPAGVGLWRLPGCQEFRCSPAVLREPLGVQGVPDGQV